MRPRAWFVRETIQLDAASALQALSNGTLPDGRKFDAATQATVWRSSSQHFSDGCSAQLRERGEGWLRLHADCEAPGFLVISERGYPGWVARIDGTRSQLERTDVLISGLQIPKGRHVVELSYEPSSFLVGAGFSAVGLLGLALSFILRRRLALHVEVVAPR